MNYVCNDLMVSLAWTESALALALFANVVFAGLTWSAILHMRGMAKRMGGS